MLLTTAFLSRAKHLFIILGPSVLTVVRTSLRSADMAVSWQSAYRSTSHTGFPIIPARSTAMHFMNRSSKEYGSHCMYVHLIYFCTKEKIINEYSAIHIYPGDMVKQSRNVGVTGRKERYDGYE